MRTHLNTLFITLEGAYLHKDGSAVEVRHEGKAKLRIPLHNLEGICCFGWDITASAALMAGCAEANISLSFHNPHGKFIACTQSFTSGNILLRRQQYRHADDPSASANIARSIVSAKIANSRTILRRAIRDYGEQFPQKAADLIRVTDSMESRLNLFSRATTVDEVRGIEGESAVLYFSVFNHLITGDNPKILMQGRTRRPPLDPVNALLSFCYTLLMHDCRSALESCGLDSQCGFLHRDRPGRPSLALDLMEELRPIIADRCALTLLNRQQITERDFDFQESGAVLLKEDSRKTVLSHWQERKKTELNHPIIDDKISYGLLPQIQARLLARHLRGDTETYPAFLYS